MSDIVDSNGYSIFHRAAFDNQIKLFEEAKDILGKEPDDD